ncbi:MAG: hypothetical protein GX640_24185 [Fibrobacter sp.]|nr:hypothetical protein [Fibrobacter sp.]
MENLMEILIPIIFFIIWTLSSISASKKKQQKPAPPERGPYQQPQYPQESVLPPPAGPVGDLKRTLETIFSEMAGERPEDVEPQPPEEKIPPEPIEPPPVQVLKTTVREKTPRQKKTLDTFAPQKEVSFSVSHQELRKAIVLMEILSPPVSMRE